MSDIYDITTADIKLGVAFPVPNASFKFWDDPGTWIAPQAWTKNNVSVLHLWAGYDDDAAATILASSPPDDNTYNLESTVKRFLNDNRNYAISQVYYSIAINLTSLTTPGANGSFRVVLGTDTESAFGDTPVYNVIKSLTATNAELTRYTGTATGLSIPAADVWCKVLLVARDAAAIAATVDNVGLMFNPLAPTNSGYYEISNVRPVSPPRQGFHRFTQDTITRLGNVNRSDESGGAEQLRLTVVFENEAQAIYENLKKLYDVNHGIPGIPGLPLLIEPNLPGYPPTFMCNMSEPQFPLNPDATWGIRYGGSVTFTQVWPGC